MSHLRPALVLLVLFTVLTGLAYPLAVPGIGQLVFPAQANGSLVEQDGASSAPTHRAGVHVRPLSLAPPVGHESANPADPTKTVDAPYNAAASTGSNLGPTSRSWRSA